MHVTYAPEGGDQQSWDWDPKRVRVSEQVIVEKQYGDSWSTFVQGALSGQAAARRVLLWHLIRRDHPAHQLRDTPDFMGFELVVTQSFAEITETYAAWIESGGAEGKDGPLLESMFLKEIEEAREREGGDPAGKVPSSNAAPPTSGS